MWLNLAATVSYESTEEMRSKTKLEQVALEEEMTSAQIEQAEELAERWMKEHIR